VPIAASIGAATFPADGRTATELIACADRRLYQVKREGGHGRDVGTVPGPAAVRETAPDVPAD
jgi:GGDEF domain-containing protein